MNQFAFTLCSSSDGYDEFQYWYNAIRPHRHLNGLTPNEQWEEINPYRKNPRQVKKVSFWNGLLTGYLLNYK
jgi:putative transposase